MSRRCRDLIEAAFEQTADTSAHGLIDSRLHDFGFRGCASVEQAMIGGSAHLLNFTGSDTMVGAYHAQFVLNSGRPIASAIPATEHSVMTAFRHEKDAFLHAIELFGSGLFACVIDSYDCRETLEKLLPTLVSYKLAKGGFMVLRPDSGDPATMVVLAMRAAERAFGCTTNSKGFKVLTGAGVIHGDGISYAQIQHILAEAAAAGFSAQNVAFGMGGNLLQRVHRDTMSFATKLCHIVESDGVSRSVSKQPSTDPGKVSLPGEFSVQLNGAGLPVVYPKAARPDGTEMLKVWYDCGPVKDLQLRATFDELRMRIRGAWKEMPKLWQPLSGAMCEAVEKARCGSALVG